jgi:hypothetical protein
VSRGAKKGVFAIKTLSKEKLVPVFYGDTEKSGIRDLVERLFVHHGKETMRSTQAMLSKQWSPGMNKGRMFPALRTGRLRESIGYHVFRRQDSVHLSNGVMVKVPLRRGELPPSIWARFHEYGKTVEMKDPKKPYFYIPRTGSPAMLPNGQIDFSWLPGKQLKQRLKAMGKRLNARAFYFPFPISKSAPKRTIYIGAVRRDGGKLKWVMKPVPIATGVRKFNIPSRPFLRPAWNEMYNKQKTGRLNKDFKRTGAEINAILRGKLRGNTTADYDNVVVQTHINFPVFGS